jgi:hypothetical protein
MVAVRAEYARSSMGVGLPFVGFLATFTCVLDWSRGLGEGPDLLRAAMRAREGAGGRVVCHVLVLVMRSYILLLILKVY